MPNYVTYTSLYDTPAWVGDVFTMDSTSLDAPFLDNLQEDNSMTQNTSTDRTEFVLPDFMLIANHFRNYDYIPSFISANGNYLSSSCYLDEVASVLNRTLNWAETPQGPSYWANVNDQLKYMGRFLRHSHLHLINPEQFNESNDPINR